MTTDVAVRDASAPLALRPGQMIFDELQQKALAAMGVKNATKADLAVYAHVCHRTRLDPFTRQIHMIERREKNAAGQWVSKQTIQTGIDGFRVIRDRAAAEQHCEVELEETIWYDADGGQHTEWLSEEAPAGCKVTLVKHSEQGRALRYPAFLRTASYLQMKDGKPVSQWRTQPEHMIEKCCEAFACRRAFPQDFSGLYIAEELNGPRPDDGNGHRKVLAADIIPRPAAQEVNDRFKALGFGPKDAGDVLAAASAFCDRPETVRALADLSPEELAEVAYRLSGCQTRDDVTELHALIIESRGPGQDGGGDE